MIRAVVFDLDGVLVSTVPLHAAAWKSAFDELLEERGAGPPFDADAEYRRYVDGKPRYEGAAAWLGARGIDLPGGSPDDAPGLNTVCALGNLKNQRFLQLIGEEGVVPLPGVPALLADLSERGAACAVVSSSRNAARVLEAAGLRFGVRVDGVDLDRLPGKPDPAMFVEATERLGQEPGSATVVEDAVAGVEAGRRGRFGLVVGIGDGQLLSRAGADIVVPTPEDMTADLLLGSPARPAVGAVHEIAARLGPRPALFCDYDGTLTPIVEDPAAAHLPEENRRTLRRLSTICPVAIISGRDLADVRDKVGIDGLLYAGSHGYEISGPGVGHFELPEAQSLLPRLSEAQACLQRAVSGLEGVHLERKRFAIAVHTRRARSTEARRAASEAAAGCVGGGLKIGRGKEVIELRPDLKWDKGRAVQHILGALDEESVPLYLGDDTTDEDAFRALRRAGGVTIHIGEGATAAEYRLADPGQAHLFLQDLADALDGRIKPVQPARRSTAAGEDD